MLLSTATALSSDQPRLQFDHVWIMVSPNAPERSALERVGLLISPDVNHHEGQGTSSITVEFQNAFIELMYPDPAVPVAPSLERASEKFHQRALWRTSGWCPIGIGLHRTTQKSDPLPFPTWSISAPWMPAGSAIEMLTPRDDTKSPSLFIEPRSLEDPAEQAKRGALYHHPIGAQRITAIRLITPKAYQPIPPLTWVQEQGVLSLKQEVTWAVELTLDDGKKGKLKDLRPDLPLILRY